MLKAHCGTEKMDCNCAKCREKMQKKLSPKQRKIAELTPPKDKIDAGDLAELRKGKGERHFYLENGKPVQWIGETHKHPDGTLMSGKEHKEGVSKKLYHFYELDEKALRHLSKDTTKIR